MNRLFIVLFGIVIGFLCIERLVFSNRVAGSIESASQSAGSTPSLAVSPPSISPMSVAVLPFARLSNGPDDDYFSDGFTEEVTNALARHPGLIVTTRSAAFRFRDQELPLTGIARELRVANLVLGSVSRAASQLRITARLVRGGDGAELWSENYDERTDDVFAIREQMAEKIATALGAPLDGNSRQGMRNAGLDDIEALTAYQKGLELFDRAHGEFVDISLLKQGNGMFERVIELSPGFPDAYARHADLFVHILSLDASGRLDGNVTFSDVDAAPRRLRSDYDQWVRFVPNVGAPLMAQTERALVVGEWRGLSEMRKRALRSPGCRVAAGVELISAAFGDAQQLAEAYSRSLACDPFSRRAREHIVNALLWSGEPVKAKQFSEDWPDPAGDALPVRGAALALAALGDHDGARQLAGGQRRSMSDRLSTLSMVAASAGDVAGAIDFEEEFLGTRGPDDGALLVLEAVQGNRHEANYLAAQIDSRPFGYMALLEAVYHCFCGAPFDVESAPRFAAALEQSGLPWPPPSPVPFPLKDW